MNNFWKDTSHLIVQGIRRLNCKFPAYGNIVACSNILFIIGKRFSSILFRIENTGTNSNNEDLRRHM